LADQFLSHELLILINLPMSDTTNKNLIERPPVVVIMGHIDHGKSTLLDYIRNTNIVAKEAGGITQHLGAYEVEHKGESGDMKRITFLDTPGHEAFCGVRDRGAKVADVAILIVSAEDGVMPQTLEALGCIKKDKLPYIVAINKIDTPKANVQNTKNSLIENEIYLEGMGGDVPFAEISAKTGDGIDTLLDLVLIVSEVEELKADPNVKATGFIIEAHKDKNKGISATLVIKDGAVEQGQFVACHNTFSPIRIFEDYNRKPIKKASFSTPVHVCGWNDFPVVGEEFQTFNSKKEAEKFCKENKEILASLENDDKKIEKPDEEKFIIPIIIKADTHGSIEAIEHELAKIEPKLSKNNAQLQVIYKATGNIGETDIKKASGNENSLVVGFGIDIDKQATIMTERLDVNVNTFKIIYELAEWVEKTTEDMRPRIEVEETLGSAKILRIFNGTKNVQVVGGSVKTGHIKSGAQAKIMRRDENIGMGKIKGLQQQKAVANEVHEGNEFGMTFESKIELAPGDFIETFEIVQK
jgi:translation initiation factor IF-2